MLKKQAGKTRVREGGNLVMVMTDPIADMLTRIRNANMVRHEKLNFLLLKLRSEIAEILKREGFVRDVEFIEDNKQGIFRIFFKYGANKERVITGIKTYQ